MKPPKPQGMVRQVIRRESSSAGTRILRLFEIAGLLLFVLGVAAPTSLMTWSLLAAALALLSPAVWRVIRAKKHGPVGVVDPALVVTTADSEAVGFDVFPVTIETDVIRYDDMKRGFFPDHDESELWSREMCLEAWARYPKAITLASSRHDLQLLAGFTMWPLTKRAYERLVRGSLTIGNLEASHIALKPGECWLVGTVVSDQKWRRAEPSLTPSVIGQALETWLPETASVSNLRIATECWTECGARLARQLGFARLSGEAFPQRWTLEGDRDSVIRRLRTAFVDYEELRTRIPPRRDTDFCA